MPVQTRSATTRLQQNLCQTRLRTHIQEILLTASVLSGQNDSIVAVPLGAEPTQSELQFQALFLACKSRCLPPSQLNNPHTDLIDSYYNGAVQASVIRHFYNETDQQHYALVSIHVNKPLLEHFCGVDESTRHTFATFAFQYWV